MDTRRTLLHLALPMLALAPSLGGQLPELRVTTDPAGRYPILAAVGQPPTWRLEAVGTIAPDEVGFTELRSVALGARGEVWIADVKEKFVERWDERGRRVERIGRVGAGPGEYREPSMLATLEGYLAVWDPPLSRVTLFARDGGEPRTVLWGRSAGPGRWYHSTRGPWLWVNTARNNQPVDGFYLLGRDDWRDSVFAPPRLDRPRPSGPICRMPDGDVRGWSTPFFAETRQVVHEGRVAWTTASDYSVAMVRERGDTILLLRRDIPAPPITDADWDAATADYRAAMRAGAQCRGSLERLPRKAAIVDLVPDDQGRLWIERPEGLGHAWDLWRGDSLVATLEAPDRIRGSWMLPVIRGDRMAVVQQTESGGHVVRVYRIVP